jgi:hypothetical protein
MAETINAARQLIPRKVSQIKTSNLVINLMKAASIVTIINSAISTLCITSSIPKTIKINVNIFKNNMAKITATGDIPRQKRAIVVIADSRPIVESVTIIALIPETGSITGFAKA